MKSIDVNFLLTNAYYKQHRASMFYWLLFYQSQVPREEECEDDRW